MRIEDWYNSLKEDPQKLAKVFKISWIIAYSVLMLGFFAMIYALFYLQTS